MPRHLSSVYERIRHILDAARWNVARSVNTAQVMAYWLIGREIVEEEQLGRKRAGYGKALIDELSRRLQGDFGRGYSVQNLRYIRQLYISYPDLLRSGEIRHAVRGELPRNARRVNNGTMISHATRGESWKPGVLHSSLSWTHYRALLKISNPEVRSFYEIEAIKNNWSARELERQVNSLLYERLALSKDKKGLMHLAVKGQEIQAPTDVFKDPVVMEFLGLPESPRLVETGLEQALIDNLQSFLLEMGRGFAFVARQQRLTLEGDRFYIDLVFYHTVLKCYVIVELKTGKLTHQDLGQLQLYVNYYDRERRMSGDNPTLGLILCADKNDTVVRYTLGPDQQESIFASRYRLHLPTVAELKAEIHRETRLLRDANRPSRSKRVKGT